MMDYRLTGDRLAWAVGDPCVFMQGEGLDRASIQRGARAASLYLSYTDTRYFDLPILSSLPIETLTSYLSKLI